MEIEIKNAKTRTETTTKGNVILKQQAALHGDDSFPLPFWLTVRPGEEYRPGRYRLDSCCFRTSRYGSLEIDPYGVKLIPLDDKAIKAA